VKVKDNAAAGPDEQERQSAMDAARHSTGQHPAAEHGGEYQVLQIGLADSGGMLREELQQVELHWLMGLMGRGCSMFASNVLGEVIRNSVCHPFMLRLQVDAVFIRSRCFRITLASVEFCFSCFRGMRASDPGEAIETFFRLKRNHPDTTPER
jgi:hypothetical protein